jgi:cytochrome c peroxidase
VERFGVGTDPDDDGVTDELSIGDVTALTVWMAALPVPGRVYPKDVGRRAAVARGEKLFAQVNCTTCHVPSMELDRPVFTEPNEFNLSPSVAADPTKKNMLMPSDVPQPFAFDLTRDGPGPRPERNKGGGATIRAFTDLKRHNITAVTGKLSEEQIVGGSLRGQALVSDFVPGTPEIVLGKNIFLTEKLWDVGSTAPYGHRGDLSTLSMAIAAHKIEAESSRALYDALSDDDKACVIEFLRSLQVVPVDSPRETFVGDDVR